ncbi:MAG: STAS domain-containing protein [Noviherbaspirillum sp.]
MFQPAFPLTLNHANAALAAGLDALRSGETRFDMGQVTAVDSAAVAILLAWRRAAAQQGVALSFSNFPPTLHSLAELYGVAGMLHA